MVTWFLIKELKTFNVKRTASSKKCWFTWQSAGRRMQINPVLSPCRKLMSKWIKDLHVKPGILNLIEEKVGQILEHRDTAKIFWSRTAVVYALRWRIEKWDLIKLQSSCKERTPPTDWQKIFTNPTSDRRLVFKIYKRTKTKTKTKTKTREVRLQRIKIILLKMRYRAKQISIKWGILNGWKAPKEVFNILIIREMQRKATLRFCLTPVRMAKIKNSGDSIRWKGCGGRKTLLYCWWVCKKIGHSTTWGPTYPTSQHIPKRCSSI